MQLLRRDIHEVKDAVTSLQRQMSGANSGAGEGPSASNISDDETSPKWCVALPVKSIGELDALEQQLAEDDEMQLKMVGAI